MVMAWSSVEERAKKGRRRLGKKVYNGPSPPLLLPLLCRYMPAIATSIADIAWIYRGYMANRKRRRGRENRSIKQENASNVFM